MNEVEGDEVGSRASAQTQLLSYAQNGEDIVLARAFPGSRGFFVDIGAYHPDHDSVTRIFSERGWRGINVDAVAEVVDLFQRTRPRDANVHAAICDHDGDSLMFVAPNGAEGHSTLVEDIATAHADDGLSFEARTVPAMRLDTLLDRFGPEDRCIDFLKVDVEGAEHDVLASSGWTRWRPRVVVVECFAPYVDGSTHTTWEYILLHAGYRVALFDGLNRFYVDAADTELLDLLAAPANVLDGFRTVQVQNLIDHVAHLESRLGETLAWADRLHAHVRELEARIAASAVRDQESPGS